VLERRHDDDDVGLNPKDGVFHRVKVANIANDELELFAPVFQAHLPVFALVSRIIRDFVGSQMSRNELIA
jgi:hypothetical protein